MSEIIADYVDHYEGEREVVDWSRRDGKTYRDVPVVYLRRVSVDDYLAEHPHMRADVLIERPERCYFWQVSVD